MDDAQTDAPKWTPDQPLRADHWHAEFSMRAMHLSTFEMSASSATDQVIKEYADARVAAALASPRATGSPVRWEIRDKFGATENIYNKAHRATAECERLNTLGLENIGGLTRPFTVRPLYDHPSPSLTSAPELEQAADMLIQVWSEKMAATSSVDEIAEIQVREAERYRAMADTLRVLHSTSLASAPKAEQ